MAAEFIVLAWSKIFYFFIQGKTKIVVTVAVAAVVEVLLLVLLVEVVQ